MGTTSSVPVPGATTTLATTRFWNTTAASTFSNSTISTTLSSTTSSSQVLTSSSIAPASSSLGVVNATSTGAAPISTSIVTTTLPDGSLTTVLITTSLSGFSPASDSTGLQPTPLPLVTDGTTTTCSELSCMPTPIVPIPSQEPCTPLSTDCAPPPPCLFDAAATCPITNNEDQDKNQLIGLFNGIIPTIDHLRLHNDDDINPIILGLDKIKGVMISMQHNLPDGAGGGGKSNDCHKSLLSFLGCAIKSVTDTATHIAGGVLTGLQDRLDDLRHLISLFPQLPKVPTISGPPGGNGGSSSGGGGGGGGDDNDGDDNDGDDNDGDDNDGDDNDGNDNDGDDDGDDDNGGGGGGGGQGTNDPKPSASASQSQSSTSSSQSSSSSTSSTTSSSSSSSSSESCTRSTTTEDVFVTCSATTTVSISGSMSSYVCATKTSVVSGCSITGATSTTSILETQTATPVPVCRAETCGAECGLQERSYAGMNESLSNDLDKRWQDYNQLGGYKAWLNARLGTLETGNPAENRIVPEDGVRLAVRADGTRDTSRENLGATSWKHVEFLKTWSGLGIRKLRGCTVVVVVSKKGAFLAHSWEIPGWARDARPGEEDQDKHEQDSSIWKQDAWSTPYNLKWTGHDGKEYKGLKELQETGEILDDPIHAHITTPYRSSNREYPNWVSQPRTYRYEPRVELLRGYLEGLGIPSVDIAGYSPTYKSRYESYFEAYGKVLVEYDPEAEKTVTRRTDGQGNTCTEEKVKAGFRIWVDIEELVHQQVWDPLDEQKDEDDGSTTPRPPGSLARRDIEPDTSFLRRLFGTWRSKARRQDTVGVCSKDSTPSGSPTVSILTSTTWSSFSSLATSSSTSSRGNSSTSFSTLATSTNAASGSQPSTFTASPTSMLSTIPTSTVFSEMSATTITTSSSSAYLESESPATISAAVLSPTPVASFDNGCVINTWGGGAIPVYSYCVCGNDGSVATLVTEGSSVYCQAWPSTTSWLVTNTDELTITTTWKSEGSYTTEFPSSSCRYIPRVGRPCHVWTDTSVFYTYDYLTTTGTITNIKTTWEVSVSTPTWSSSMA